MKNKTGVIIGFSLIIISLIVMVIFWRWLPAELPWLYSLPWGEKWLVSRYWFAGGVLILGGVFGIDVFLGHWLAKTDEVLGTVVVWFGVGVIVIYLASLIRVLSLMLTF